MIKNKSTLAKLLAEEDIFVVHKQMETAYFNSKSRELGLPIWKDEDMTKNIYDLMVGHEIGHALWTPLDMLEKAAVRKINHSFVNIIEDARIEKFAKRKYPGLVGVFKRGYADLTEKDFFGTSGKDVNSYNLIDRINIFFKGGDTNIEFSDEEKVWVDRVSKVETEDEVLDLAEELYAWMAENESETDNHDSGEKGSEMGMPDESDDSGETSDSDETGDSGEGDETGESDDGNSDASGADADDGESGNDASEGKSAASGEDGDENESSVSEKTDESSDVVGGKETTGGGNVPEAKTDTASKEGMDNLRDKDAGDRNYGRIPKVNIKDIIVDNKTLLEKWKTYYLNEKSGGNALFWNKTLEEVETLKNDSKKTVAYMVKEFEMKKAADQYARAASSKTGSLDMSKLHTYKYNDDLFRKVTTLPGATNHGMVMVLDWSGSMSTNLIGTLSQMYNLIWFCRRTKIPFEVFAFSDAYYRDPSSRYGRMDDGFANEFKSGDIALSTFNLLNFFSSNMSVSDEMDMMHILWMFAVRYMGGYRDWTTMGFPYNYPRGMSLGGTPLNEAIIAMMDIVPKFKNETGVQKVNTIFLTDGASNSLNGVFDYGFNPKKNEHFEIVKSLRQSYRHKSKTVITDPVMNKTYEITDVTNDLLRILKGRVPGMNVVGFFIAGSGRNGRISKNTLYYLLRDTEGFSNSFDITEKIKFINKNKYLAISQLGYDEYYILPGGDNLKTENETLDDELIGAGKAKLKSAFGKMAKGKISSRQVLNKFVSLVA
ncbi:MAG: hypothetical protein MK217_07250 [Gammaproteobacteria bacterium]|nr:hypothetical protein [Gammaproteobacteria bacterium]